MTLNEAILHCEEKSDCSECGKEHLQLAEWLKELKHLRETAYDVEAVVKQIVDYRELVPGWALKEIIEIVKNGGVNNGRS